MFSKLLNLIFYMIVFCELIWLESTCIIFFYHFHSHLLDECRKICKELNIILTLSNSNNDCAFSLQFFIHIKWVASIHEVLHPGWDITKIDRWAKNNDICLFHLLINFFHVISATSAIFSLFAFIIIFVDKLNVFLSQI